jgi:hypothetical protein
VRTQLFPALIGVLLGAWFVFDGLHVLIKGQYFGPAEPGPWARIVSALQINPVRMGVPFVVLGLIWFAVSAGLITGGRWASPLAIVAVVGTVWYLPLGTLLSILFLTLLLLRR